MSDFAALLGLVCGSPDDADLLMVTADAADEIGKCGDALRWASYADRRPHKDSFKKCGWWYIRSEEDEGYRPINGLPLIFGQSEGQFFPSREGHSIRQAWEWLIENFPLVRERHPDHSCWEGFTTSGAG